MKELEPGLSEENEKFKISKQGALLLIITLIVLLLGFCATVKLVRAPEQPKTGSVKPPSYDLDHIQR